MNKKSLRKRFLHWGPILDLNIISCIALTTLYISDMWLPFYGSLIGFITHLIFLSCLMFTLKNLFICIFIGPGYPNENWIDKALKNNGKYFLVNNYGDDNNINEKKDIDYYYKNNLNTILQWCNSCKIYKPPRAHHCRSCDICVLKMEHHCPWINNCVGHKNHSNFIYFLISALIGNIMATFLLTSAVYRSFHLEWYYHQDRNRIVLFTYNSFFFTVLSLTLSISIAIAIMFLLYIQLKVVSRNRTSIEDWILKKAINRKQEKPFLYPYDVGLKRNFSLVFSSSSSSNNDGDENDGIFWPIVDGCNQFTLTIEQILQKKEKRLRTLTYETIYSYNGRKFPFLSQGIMVCLTTPWSNEPHLPLQINDQIDVTRWRKRWFYGEKISSINDDKKKTQQASNRGWFPRRCVRMLESSYKKLENSQKYQSDKQEKND